MMRLRTAIVSSAATIALAVAASAASGAPQHVSAHSVTVQIKGLPHACSVTSWEYFKLPPSGHQPWRFTMHYGAGTSCAGGGGLKLLTVEVDRRIGKHWQIVDRPVTNRIARPTRQNPLRISASWTALPSTPAGTPGHPVKYRVLAVATVSFQKRPQIPPQNVKGLTGYGTAVTPPTGP